MTTSSDSRFNPFKFGSSKPPPLPPKDLVYLQRTANRSFASLLSPDAGVPPSPISPNAQYATVKRANSPGPSPMFADSNNNHSSSSVAGPSSSPKPTTMTKSNKLAFLKFPKRSPKYPATPSEAEQPHEDENISLPWGFSHNIHVDEGFVGLPPSWSTTLPQLGFTDEEIAQIQARRAAGARSPPELKYLYQERPHSPAGPSTLPSVPIIANPMPRSTSLPIDQANLPKPVPGLTSSLSSSRIPPPTRKPPSPTELTSRSHRPNQPSQGTVKSFSTDSHAHNNTFTDANNSIAYQYNPSQSTSNLSTRTTTDENTPLALAPLRLGSETTDTTVTQPHARFKIVNGDSEEPHEERERKPSIWGTKRTKPREHTKDISLSSTRSRERNAEGELPHDLVSHFSISPPPQQASWVTAASTSFASASSTIAAAGSAAVNRVKNTAGKGLVKVRGKNSMSSRDHHQRKKSQETTEDESGDVISIGHESADHPAQEPKPSVWQIYTRPRAGTDASASHPSLVRKESTGQTSLSRSASQGQLRAQYVAAGWTVPPINATASSSTSAVPSTSSAPQRPTRSRSNSQSSLHSKGSKSSLHSLARMRDLKHSASSTSLESIPEASPALPSSIFQASSSQPHLPSHGASSSGSLSRSNSRKREPAPPLPASFALRSKAAGMPPRLSLHQSRDSSDLSLWSEALLSGITLGGDKDLDLKLKLDFNSTEASAIETAKPSLGASSYSLASSVSSTSTNNSSSNIAGPSKLPTTRKPGQPTTIKPRLAPPVNPPPPPPIPGPSVTAVQKPHPYAAVMSSAASSTSTLGRSRSNSRSRGDARTNGVNGSTSHRPQPPPSITPPPPLHLNQPPQPPSQSQPQSTPIARVPPILPLTTAKAGTTADGLLSAPIAPWSARATNGNGNGSELSPAPSSNGPDSAQLWNEIELMMDSSVVGTLPALGMSAVRLPPGGVLRSAAVTPGGVGGELATVGDLVGKSPTREEMLAIAAAAAAGKKSPGTGPRKSNRRMLSKEDEVSLYVEEEDEDEEEESDEDEYDEEAVEHQVIRIGRQENQPQRTFHPVRKVGASRSRSRSREKPGLLQEVIEQDRDTQRDSTRSSTSTLTVPPTTIVRSVSVARRAGAYVIDQRKQVDAKQPPSLSSIDDSEESGGSGSSSTTSHPTASEPGTPSPLNYYLEPSPAADHDVFKHPPGSVLKKTSDPYGYDDEDEEEEEEEEEEEVGHGPSIRPTIVISDDPPSPEEIPPTGSATPGTSLEPLSPFQRYRGWVTEVVAPLEEFIDEAVDPRDHYLDLKEIGESGSGSVYQALVNPSIAHKLRLSQLIKEADAETIALGRPKLVAIKSVAIVPSGSPKLVDIGRELTLMKGRSHDHILNMDAVYVDLVDDALWLRMELMERSLADVIGLVASGLMLQDRMIARFASDMLQALDFLQQDHIAHRDLRSDNLLVNQHGLLKLADFSTAVRVTKENPMRSDVVGVLYWQAPEVLRGGSYNALKVDVWSLGATVWEMAQTEPPFIDTNLPADRWPPLSEPQLYSPHFHEFLRKCSEPGSSRPSPQELLKTAFINNACGRPVIVQLLSQCMAIEEALQAQA